MKYPWQTYTKDHPIWKKYKTLTESRILEYYIETECDGSTALVEVSLMQMMPNGDLQVRFDITGKR